MAVSYLGMGSNLGDRRKNIARAVRKINSLKGTKVLEVSGIIETKPVGGPRRQGKFLNAVLKMRTGLSPSALLGDLKRIEKELGRSKAVRYGPRTIDLDILLYADRVIERKELTVPHPKIFERDFVLKPLMQVL